MKFIDQRFLQDELSFQGFGFLPFIEWSISEIISENRNNDLIINTTEVFWLFSYIKNNVRSTLAQLYNYDIENDVLGFPSIQRELRHSIEAFLDLNNLVVDKNYKCVLSYCSNSKKKERNNIELGDYKKYLFNNEFTIQSKYNISKLEKGALMEMAKAANSYTHPDVYLDTNKISSNREQVLINLLRMNVYLLSKSYILFTNGVKSYGASTFLLNNTVTAYGYQYQYMELYRMKELCINNAVQDSLIINQPNRMLQNYML